jgi:hypothetical protein
MMHKALFTIDGFQCPHIGYTEGKRWNGWATPYFEIDEALKVMEEFNSYGPDFPIVYDKETDTFTVEEIGGGNGDEWKGTNYQTEEGIKHLYSIGAYSWVWELTTQDDIYAVAQRIEELIGESLIKQLQDFNTLKRVLKVLYSETSDLRDMTTEEILEALGLEVRI